MGFWYAINSRVPIFNFNKHVSQTNIKKNIALRNFLYKRAPLNLKNILFDEVSNEKRLFRMVCNSVVVIVYLSYMTVLIFEN